MFYSHKQLIYAVTHPLFNYTYLLTYLLTYSMVQSPSWEANWSAASQETPRISRNPKVHYRTHKRPPTVPILGQPNPVHIHTSHLLEIRSNIIRPSTPRSPQWSPSLWFPHHLIICFKFIFAPLAGLEKRVTQIFLLLIRQTGTKSFTILYRLMEGYTKLGLLLRTYAMNAIRKKHSYTEWQNVERMQPTGNGYKTT